MLETTDNKECYTQDIVGTREDIEGYSIPKLKFSNNKFLERLKLDNPEFIAELHKATDSFMQSRFSILETLALNVSRQYFNYSLECNKEKNVFSDDVQLSLIRLQNNNLESCATNINLKIYPRFVDVGMISSYDIANNQAFPIFYPKRIGESIMIEYMSVNSKVVTMDKLMKVYVVDLDADRRQEIELACSYDTLKDVTFIPTETLEDYIESKKNGDYFGVKATDDNLTGRKINDITSSIDILHKRLEWGPDYSAYKKFGDNGEYKIYDMQSEEETNDLYISDYISRYGCLLREDIEQKRKYDNGELKEQPDIYKYGWFVTSQLYSEFEFMELSENIESVVFNINFYRFCISKLNKNNIQLSENNWKLIEKHCIIIDDTQIDLYAKLENGHRVVALYFRYNEVENETIHPNSTLFDNDTEKKLDKYIKADFTMSKERFEEAQRDILKYLLDNNKVKLFNTEQELKNNLAMVVANEVDEWDEEMECLRDPIIRASFYNKVYDKYILFDIEIGNNRGYNRLYNNYPFLEFSYPLNIAELAIVNKSEDPNHSRKAISQVIMDANLTFSGLVLNDIIVDGNKVVILDEVRTTTGLYLLYTENMNDPNKNSESDRKEIKVIDIMQQLTLLKIVAGKNVNDKDKEVSCRLCKKKNSVDFYMIRRLAASDSKNKKIGYTGYSYINLGHSMHKFIRADVDYKEIGVGTLNIIK